MNPSYDASSFHWEGETILIAEDIDVNYLFLEKILLSTGANIIRAKSGEDALDLINKKPKISLVLMDIQMPGLNGFDATKQIKAIKPSLPVIIQTIHNIDTARENSIEAGADAFIQKPLNINKLLSILDKFIRTGSK
ncbi:MAG TPA: response regulator [Salinivirgaceae bacterium]|nr:response regulator [Salinivirgaceae bacterium]